MGKMFATRIEKIIAGGIVAALVAIAVLWGFGVFDTTTRGASDDFDWSFEEPPPPPQRPVRDMPDLSPYTVVARFDGNDIYAYAVHREVRRAEHMLFWDYVELFEEWEIDFERIMPDGRTFERHVQEEAVRLVAQKMILAQIAERLGITVSDADVTEIAEMIEESYQAWGAINFSEALRGEAFRDRDHLQRVLEVEQVERDTILAIIDNPAEFAAFEPFMQPMPDNMAEAVLGAKHILALFENFASEAEARTFAEEMHARAIAGEDFDMLVREYGQDPGMFANPQGYSFVAGAMVDEFYAATRALEIGEISGLVRSMFGYHIIQRVEPDHTDVMRPQWVDEPLTEFDFQIEAISLGLQYMADRIGFEFLPELIYVDVWPYHPEFVDW